MYDEEIKENISSFWSDIIIRFSDPDFVKDSNNLVLKMEAKISTFDRCKNFRRDGQM